jgi:hypothetical protein
VSEPAGTIYDLGYKRYLGTRRPPSTRWRVIARHQIATGWKGWWRFKTPLAVAVIFTVIAAVFIFVATTKTLHLGRGVATTFANFAMPFAVDGACKTAFLVSLTIGAGVIASDMKSGAFVFYFARSTRPIDYLAGKLAGYGALVWILVGGGTFVVAAMRLGLAGYDHIDELVPQLVLLPKTLAIGLVATAAYTAVPLGFSALVSNKRTALGLWAAYYLVVGSIVTGVGQHSGSQIAALDMSTAVKSFALHLLDFDQPGMVSMTAAIASIAGHVTFAVGLIWYQLSTAQKAGVGGAT